MPTPKQQPAQVLTTDLPDAAVNFNGPQFDNAIREHGVTFVHWRAMACPVGMIDEHDVRRPHEDHSGCSNGFLYTLAGEITCLFTGNGTSSTFGEMGILDSSSVAITIPTTYDGTSQPVHIAPFDRLFLREESIVVPDWQRFRTNGIKDKLRFPVVTIDDLVDSNFVYYKSCDFSLEQGQVVWGDKRPGIDPKSGRGLICSVRFTYRPYWYLKSMTHEVRVTQGNDPITGARVVQRMPQAAMLQREYVFEKNDRDELAPDKARQVAPPDGPRFGPR